MLERQGCYTSHPSGRNYTMCVLINTPLDFIGSMTHGEYESNVEMLSEAKANASHCLYMYKYRIPAYRLLYVR